MAFDSVVILLSYINIPDSFINSFIHSRIVYWVCTIVQELIQVLELQQ